jgi:hypothetical protein
VTLNYTVANMSEAVTKRLHPAITRWNRLEGRPRTHDFDRALRAEVRDALWFLSRQWQMGEFQGDDAGSPVLARVCIDVADIDRFQPGTAGAVQSLVPGEPIEPKVEARPLPLRIGAQYLSLDLRLAVGRRWLKMLAAAAAAGDVSADFRDAYVDQYAVAIPDPTAPEDAMICAHADAWQKAGLVGERAMDGIALLEYLREDATHRAADGIAGAAGDAAALTTLAGRLDDWLASLIIQPSAAATPAEASWVPERLEYTFGCSARAGANDTVMRAPEYSQGDLDWYALDRRPAENALGAAPNNGGAPERQVKTFIPTQLVFEGMPNTRWWAFEDRRTNFGDVKPDSTDLGKLLLLEFGLVYANDWFVLPYQVPVSSVVQTQGIALSNVFGERFWIEPVRPAPAVDWQSWSMFALTDSGGQERAAAARLVMLATAPKVQEGPVLEEVALLRDEMANMVWGVERRVPLPSGTAKPGNEAAREFRQWLQRLVGPEPAPEAPIAAVRYEVMNTVPEQWIPFIPVHIAGSTREIQLQRAALLRVLAGDLNPPEKVRPRTTLLRQNLPSAYYVFEEEVPRAGVVVSLCYQRTRWLHGQVVTWLGAAKQTGRGEGKSGLLFDSVIAAPVSAP